MIEAAVWDAPVMRDALRQRDIRAVFVLLRRHGISQRRIAALTGQSQSEVSDIAKGRQVMAYDVLARIADGLGCPRGLMGLAYSPDTEVSAALTAGPVAAREVDTMPDRREFLGVAAKAAVGAALSVGDLALLATPAHATPTPARVGASEVESLRALTRALWVQEKQRGGGVVRDAVIAQLGWARQLLQATHTDQIGQQLYAALADLLSLAGWASHDVGLSGAALRYLGQSMAAASEINDPLRTTLALEQVARVYLRQDQPCEAVKVAQLAQVAAARTDIGQAHALVASTAARAHAEQGHLLAALGALNSANAALESAGGVLPEPRGFDAAALASETGRVLSIAARHDRTHAVRAVDTLTTYTATTDPLRVKRRAISTAQLAAVHFRAGNPDEAVTAARVALDLAASIRSQRLGNYLNEVRLEALRHPRHADAAELAHAVTTYRA
ncbi:helix-turn-helix transcriptional regulator [Amycolatopsis minnesotensis]|uniref:helix-turn-helix transcriptional regulator n=1 Tax=Amycolatopsis minnesotensis TaxID=337894 RepID=UPI0031CFF2FE